MIDAQFWGMLSESLNLLINGNDRSSDFVDCVLARLLDFEGAVRLGEDSAGAEEIARITKRPELVAQHPSKDFPATFPKGNLGAEFKVTTPNFPASVFCTVHEFRFLNI
jgi:hypothetical protein